MKKTITMILTASLLMLTACSTETTTTNNPSLEHKGLELIAEVDTLAENEEYISLLGGGPELTDMIADIASGDYATPKAVFVMKDLDKTVLDAMLGEQSLSDDVADMIKGKFASVLPSQINAMGGVSNVAVSSMLTHSDSFIYEGLTTTNTYLYTFDSNYCFMVNFVPNDENIVNANVTIVMNEDLASADSVEEVEDFMKNALSFEEVSVSTATVEE